MYYKNEVYIMVNIKMIKQKEKEYFFLRVEINMNGKMKN